MLAGKRVWVAGHTGLVGSALVRRLSREDCELLTVGRAAVDLRRQAEVEGWVADARPQVVFVAAGTVGGILGNASRPADFLFDNLQIAANVIEASRRAGVEKLLYLGSSCIYPKFAEQPIVEEALLTGPLEPTNEAYAIAKIAGVRLAQAYRRQHGCDFIAAMPTSLYGPGDTVDPLGGHVLPALLHRFHHARRTSAAQVVLWGSGAPRRELMHVDDCADALVCLMQRYSGDVCLNVGCGQDVTISQLAGLVAGVVGFEGEIAWDPGKPDGTPRKLLDCRRLRALGWTPRIALADGIADTYAWYLQTPLAQAAA